MIAKFFREGMLRLDWHGIHDVGKLSTEYLRSPRSRSSIGLVIVSRECD
jgi:hypothetical protein